MSRKTPLLTIGALCFCLWITSFNACAGGNRRALSNDEIASRFTSEIPIPNIPAIVVKNRTLAPSFKPQLFVEPIKDGRESNEILRVGSKTLRSRGKIDLFVFYALREAFRQQGVAIIDNAPVVVSLSVLKWVATIDGENGSAEAVVSVNLAGPDGGQLYSRSYDGLNAFNGAVAQVADVQVALGQAMASALGHVVSDKELLELVASY